jgi:hypothetical protein
MAAVKEKFGRMNCPGCQAAGRPDNSVLVRKNANGTLSAGCDECDDTQYARPGTTKHADWLRRITPLASPAAAPEKKPEAKPEPKPAAKPAPAPAARAESALPWAR